MKKYFCVDFENFFFYKNVKHRQFLEYTILDLQFIWFPLFISLFLCVWVNRFYKTKFLPSQPAKNSSPKDCTAKINAKEWSKIWTRLADYIFRNDNLNPTSKLIQTIRDR